MDFLSIDGQYGHYKLILKEIEVKNIAYIIIDSYSDLKLVLKEAKAVLDNYHPKNIYFRVKEPINDYPLHCTIDCYLMKHQRFKINKDMKFKPLDLENRYDYPTMCNKAMEKIDCSATLTDGDVFQMMKDQTNNMGYIQYKKQFVAGYNICGNTLDTFFVDKAHQNQGIGKMALEKIINKIDDDVYLNVASTNSIAINLYQRYGFTYDHTVSYFYKLEEK